MSYEKRGKSLIRKLFEGKGNSAAEKFANTDAGVWHTELPKEDNQKTLLLIASGRGGDMILKDALVVGCYMGNGTWFLEDYPEIDDAIVKYWTEAPRLPGEV